MINKIIKVTLKINSYLVMGVIITTLSTQSVLATELVIEDNGSSSDNQINLNTNNTQSVTQENNANIENNIVVNADTGSNTAEGNTDGDSSIVTGDINVQTNVENHANVSQVTNSCCPSGGDSNNSPTTTLLVSGNGSNSENSIGLSSSHTTEAIITQTANIENHIAGIVNTGLNTIKDNTNGNIKLETGNIWINNAIKNEFVNLADIQIGTSFDNIVAKILGNGADSENHIAVKSKKDFITYIQNLANISNVIDFDANTGGNLVQGNTGGSVDLNTGDINIDNVIDNGPINSSIADTDCCQNGAPVPVDQPHNPSNNPAPASVPTGGVGPSAGQILAAAIETAGQILPATGSQWIQILTLMSVLMFLLGLYLRLHPGQDPGTKPSYLFSN